MSPYLAPCLPCLLSHRDISGLKQDWGGVTALTGLCGSARQGRYVMKSSVTMYKVQCPLFTAGDRC